MSMTMESAPPVASRRIASPVGALLLCVRDGQITRLTWCAARTPETASGTDADKAALDRAAAQLGAYFAGDLTRFDLPLAPAGSPFQRRVWAAMSEIPFGRTRTYGELARDVGGVARAVGQACGANPIPIIIPCHRVVAGGGRLGGFSGGHGRDSKRALLAHERAVPEGGDLFALPAQAVTNAPSGR
jgi:methylated-DNA-[protein]-cysteine S-methyltransferase